MKFDIFLEINNLKVLIHERSEELLKDGILKKYYVTLNIFHAMRTKTSLLLGNNGQGATIEEAKLDFMNKLSNEIIVKIELSLNSNKRYT